jgi:PAS domain S-box-containing protein
MDIMDACCRSPNLLEKILSSIRHAVIITDIKGEILFANQIVKEIFGAAPENLRGQNLSVFFTPEDMACLYPNLLSMAGHDRFFEGELMLMRKDGVRFFAYMIFNPLSDQIDGNKLVAISIQDIDEEKALKKSIQTTRYEDLIKVADGIAHELRNPLVGIGGFVNRLYRSCKAGNSENDKYYEYIIKNLDKIEGLVRKIQFFVKLPDPSFARHDTESLINRALEVHKGQIEKKQIKLSIKVEKAILIVDGDLVVRVIAILIENALDALNEGGRIDIEGKIEEDSYELTVSDNGHGISPSDIPYIFNPFFTTKAQGAGIDLAVAKRIIDRHGGSIEAESDPGKKSTILLAFPLERRRAIRASRFENAQDAKAG